MRSFPYRFEMFFDEDHILAGVPRVTARVGEMCTWLRFNVHREDYLSEWVEDRMRLGQKWVIYFKHDRDLALFVLTWG